MSASSSALARRRQARRDTHVLHKEKRKELARLKQQGFRSVAHKKRFDDRVARNPALTRPHVSWNDCKAYGVDGLAPRSAAQIHRERARNSEILELDYLHELNEQWLADQERAYVDKRGDMVRVHQACMAMMAEDFHSRFRTLDEECVSKQELRIESKMLAERMQEDDFVFRKAHKNTLVEFDADFEAELRRFTQVIRKRTDDWIAHCRLYDAYVAACKEARVPVCTRYATELGHQHVSLENYGLGRAGCRALAESTLARNCFLHQLDLSGNSIGDDGARALALAIRGGKGNGMLTGKEKRTQLGMLCVLRDLRVARNRITSEGASYLLEACCLGKDRPRTPADVVARRRKREERALRKARPRYADMGAGDGSSATTSTGGGYVEGWENVGEDDPANKGGEGGGLTSGAGRRSVTTVVEILDLANNDIDDRLHTTLEAVLSSHLCGLRKLDLSYNKLGPRSAAAVAQGLLVNRTLLQLSLRWNVLGKRGCTEIASAVHEGNTLETLDLGMTRAGDECAAVFAEALAERPPATGLADHTATNSGATTTAAAAAAAAGVEATFDSHTADRGKTSALVQLLLDHNAITADGARPLLEALLTNTHARVLDISGNHVGIGAACEEQLCALRGEQTAAMLEQEAAAAGALDVLTGSMQKNAGKLNPAGSAGAAAKLLKLKLSGKMMKAAAESGAAGSAPKKTKQQLKQEAQQARRQARALADLPKCYVGVDVAEVKQARPATGRVLSERGGQQQLPPLSPPAAATSTGPTSTASKVPPRYVLCPRGGVDHAHLRHESHETDLTASVSGHSMSLLRDHLYERRRKLAREKTRRFRKRLAAAAKLGGLGAPGSEEAAAAAKEEEEMAAQDPLDAWLRGGDGAIGGEGSLGMEVPPGSFPHDFKVPVELRFTTHLSANAMSAATDLLGHESPHNVVRVLWPVSVLPAAVLRDAEKQSRKITPWGKGSLRGNMAFGKMKGLMRKAKARVSVDTEGTKTKDGGGVETGATAAAAVFRRGDGRAAPCQFRVQVSRVSTTKGDGTRYCVTNSLECEYTLPACLENEDADEDADDEGGGVTYGAGAVKEATKRNRRESWVDRMAAERAQREAVQERDRIAKAKAARMEEEAEGFGHLRLRDEADSEEDSEEYDAEETGDDGAGEEDGEGGGDDTDADEDDEEISVPKDKEEDLPSLLLTWEPMVKSGGQRLVQFTLPMFFLAGLDLDLGATIMIRPASTPLHPEKDPVLAAEARAVAVARALAEKRQQAAEALY